MVYLSGDFHLKKFFLRRRRGSGGIIVFVKIKAKTTGLFCHAAFAVTLPVVEIACCL